MVVSIAAFQAINDGLVPNQDKLLFCQAVGCLHLLQAECPAPNQPSFLPKDQLTGAFETLPSSLLSIAAPPGPMGHLPDLQTEAWL